VARFNDRGNEDPLNESVHGTLAGTVLKLSSYQYVRPYAYAVYVVISESEFELRGVS